MTALKRRSLYVIALLMLLILATFSIAKLFPYSEYSIFVKAFCYKLIGNKQKTEKHKDMAKYWQSEAERVIEERERGAYIENRLVEASANQTIIVHDIFPEYPIIFDRNKIFSLNEKTWFGLNDSINRHYLNHKDRLVKSWQIPEELIKSVYLMNVVHHLYKDYVPSPQGHRHARENRDDMTPAAYLSSLHADCKDYAFLLYMLLNMNHIKAKQVGTGDHVYIEAMINQKNYILDPTFNFFVKMNNRTFLNQKLNQPVDYHLFPYLSVIDRKDKKSFKAPKNLYVYLYTRGRVFRGKEEKVYHGVNQFDKWLKENKVPVELIKQG